MAYSSKTGSTEITAKDIGRKMSEMGFSVKFLDLGSKRASSWPLPSEFDGVLVGTGIRMGRWFGPSKKFLKKNLKGFGGNGPRLGIFVSCFSVLEEKDDPVEKYISEKVDKWGLKPDLSEAFAGVVDFRDGSRKDLFGKIFLRVGAEDMFKDMDVELDENGLNDLRDREKIDGFAKRFAEML